MKFDKIQKQVRQQRCAGFSYAQEKPAAGFRDVVTVYCDGRLLFERFCAGEAAGRVCALWAPGAGKRGAFSGITAHAPIPGHSRRRRF